MEKAQEDVRYSLCMYSQLVHIHFSKSEDSDLTEDANSDTDKKKKTKQQSDGFKCNQCKKVFNRKSNLSRHKLIHLGKTQTCDCGKIFASPAAMKEHRKRHADPLIFTCWHADCGKVYSRRYSLQQHVRRDHGDHVPNISVFKCEVCDRDFSQKGHLREHMLRHTTDKQWMCQRCGKTMKYSRSLQRHVFRCKATVTQPTVYKTQPTVYKTPLTVFKTPPTVYKTQRTVYKTPLRRPTKSGYRLLNK
ncbi:Hypothetical predicted protein, partial [Mytilus galloprovincialis]